MRAGETWDLFAVVRYPSALLGSLFHHWQGRMVSVMTRKESAVPYLQYL